ncbi:MAG: type III-B CRISPR module RAMP protein Cmr4 [Acidilobaceae archaeon]
MSYPILEAPPAYSYADLVIVKALTPVHAGVGRAGGLVDLPVQRDEHGYPCIYSSSLKGALKTALIKAYVKELGNVGKARMAVSSLLGAEPEEGETFESSIAILDSLLLVIPVRSLKGIYAYVTSPYLLDSFLDRCSLIEAFREAEEVTKTGGVTSICRELKEWLGKNSIKSEEAVCVKGCETIKINELEGKAILAEEFILTVTDKSQEASGLVKLVEKLKLNKPLLVLNDDTARELIERSIVRLTRVRLKRETKKVDAGPWTEEYIPGGTMLHTLFLYKRPHCKGAMRADEYIQCLKDLKLVRETFRFDKDVDQAVIAREGAKNVKDIISRQLKNYVVLGGHETIGKGIVELLFLGGETQ